MKFKYRFYNLKLGLWVPFKGASIIEKGNDLRGLGGYSRSIKEERGIRGIRGIRGRGRDIYIKMDR